MERWHTRLRSLSLGFSFTLDEKPLKKGGPSPSHTRPSHGAVPAGHMDQGHYDDCDMSSANPQPGLFSELHTDSSQQPYKMPADCHHEAEEDPDAKGLSHQRGCGLVGS